MKWEDSRLSDNIEDRRGDSGDGDSRDGGTGMAMMPGLGGGGGGLGIGTIIVLAVIGYATGIDPRLLISGAGMIQGTGHRNAAVSSSRSGAPPDTASRAAPSDRTGRFVAAVLAENEDVWTEILPAQKNIPFRAPGLVMFSGATRSACGAAQAAMGPFYCPTDQKIYLDTSFFQDMQTRYGGGGDFAYAYVIAHEMGHHIENQLGILDKADRARQQLGNSPKANQLSVRVELMADCLAGVWAAHANQRFNILEPGDVEKAVATASAIGDDRLQQAARGRIVPDSFTHGSSAARVQWLKKGLDAGQIDACNTFGQAGR
jgi:predicted metalloprotease